MARKIMIASKPVDHNGSTSKMKRLSLFILLVFAVLYAGVLQASDNTQVVPGHNHFQRVNG